MGLRVGVDAMLITYLLAIDPGVHQSAVAAFDLEDNVYAYSVLVRPGEVLPARLRSTGIAVGRIVIEKPRSYPKASAIDNNDLIDLALAGGIVAGRIAGACYDAPITELPPATWKGQVPKPIHHERLQRLLSDAELQHIQRDMAPIPASLQHNLWDAIGLGLYALGRTGRGGTRS